jgi:hypothetical protein
VPAVREDGPEVSSGQRDGETDDRREHPFPRTGRVLHAGLASRQPGEYSSTSQSPIIAAPDGRLRWKESDVRLAILVASVLVCAVSPALAQTEGRISIGGSVTFNSTTDSKVASAVTGGPLVRLNPHKGWGPAGAFNWFRADLQNPAGGSDDFARLRVRPLMGGVSYTVGPRAVLTSFSVVLGPSFNRAEFQGSYVRGLGESITAKNSFAVRPGVGLTWTVARRVAVIGFAGYLINRPDVTYRNRSGQEITGQWKADAVVTSVGLVYSVF